MKPFFIANLMETLSVYVIKRDFVIIRDLYREMKIFPGKLRYNQRFAIAGYVINREYCVFDLERGRTFLLRYMSLTTAKCYIA
jgi:hypothetical protein